MATAPRALSRPSASVVSDPVRGILPKRKHRYLWSTMIPWVIVHLLPFLVFFTGVTWESVVVCVALHFARIFFVTAGYHRYFAHRTFETSRVFQFILAFLAESTVQRGVLWWAAHHRAHHLYSDSERDLHSPKQDGFLHSHFLWLFTDVHDTDMKRIQDFAKYPELRWLDRFYLVPPIVVGFTIWWFFSWPGLLIGFFLSTVVTWHSTYTINSLCHVFGSRRFATRDTSRNNLLLALLTLGEGWHNNHHHYMNSARQGFYWWEIDITYYILKGLEAVGIVWGIKEPPARVLEAGRAADRAARAA